MNLDPAAQTKVVRIYTVGADEKLTLHDISLPALNLEPYEDVAFMTAMTLVLLGNYAQTGHYGGPLAYTPYNVAVHLGGPELGALRYDLREPKHPYADKFMLAGGHSIPTCYALWMILYEALRRQREETGNPVYAFDPGVAILPIDALGFRRSAGALKTLLAKNGLSDHPLFRQARIRGIRALAGHAETTDVTNDVNGGPSGIGIAAAAGKAAFWDMIGAGEAPKIIAFEGEFAMTEGHAQELKTAAVAQQVGKRLRILLSFNNAGIDDELIGSIIKPQYQSYDIAQQWVSYGWNVFALQNGNDFRQIFAALKAMEDWPAGDRRPMIAIGRTIKGWWPSAENGKILGDGDQLVSYPSHPYSLPMNSPYFVALAETFERRYGVKFEGIRDGKPAAEADRLVQFKTNIDVALSVLDRKPALREWIADRLVAIAGKLDRRLHVRIDTDKDPFQDERLKVENLPTEPVEVSLKNPSTGEEVRKSVRLFLPAGEKKGTRRAISEIGKWLNYVTEGRFLTIAADLSDSINVEHAHFFGHYDPVANPAGTRLKAPIQEAVNVSTIIGALSQNASPDPQRFAGLWGLSGTYGAFTPLMYTPARVFSQQNQDSPFALGVLTILAGHSGPETAADARTHFGIFAPQVWTLLPRRQVINLYFWDYNDVAPGYFAAVEKAACIKEAGLIVIHVARPDFRVADRSSFADSDLKAAAKGIYLIRDYDARSPRMGTVWVQGASSTVNLVSAIQRLEAEKVNVRIASVISPELFAWQAQEYRDHIYPESARFDSMVVSTMTKRVPPLPDLGPVTEEYSLYADYDDRWRTGGTEEDVIAESRLDPESVFQGVLRFAREREARISRQRRAIALL
jgi:transketolase